MPRSLPDHASLEVLKKQAKALLKSRKQENPGDSVGLQDCQHLLAQDYGFKNWTELERAVLGKAGKAAIRYILCGDMCGGSLRDSTVPGDVFVWHEVYIRGAAPGDMTYEEFRLIRGEVLATCFHKQATQDELRERAAQKYPRLDLSRDYGEVVLWYDACLFDQTHLIHQLDFLATELVPALRVEGPRKLTAISKVDSEPLPEGGLKKWRVSLTEFGRLLLSGGADFVATNGIDRWLGGVHLEGSEARWRWNGNKLAAIRPKDESSELADPRNRRAKELCKSQEWGQLLAHAESWLRDQPSAHYPVYYRTNALWGLERWQEAADGFRRAKELEPKWSEPCDSYIKGCEQRMRGMRRCGPSRNWKKLWGRWRDSLKYAILVDEDERVTI